MQVSDVMTSPVISVEPSASIGAAARLMLANKISGLPVVDQSGAPVGIVSEGDFLRRGELGTERKRPRWLEFFIGPGKSAEEYIQAHSRKVEEVMTPGVVSVGPEATLDEAVETLIRHRIKRLPVVREGKLVGIVTRSDLLKALTRVLPDGTLAPPSSDERIRATIEAELGRQDWAGNGLIRVEVIDGVVELTGTIFDERQRRAAHVLAENVQGVKSVTDSLVWIEPVSGFVVMPSDDRKIG